MQAWVNEKRAKRPVLADWPQSGVGPGQIGVLLEATAIHPVDLETSKGDNAMMLAVSRPFVGGVDFVGTVAELGAGVTDLSVGDRVYGYRGVPSQGAWAEQLAVARSEVARAPDLPLEILASLPLPALCALQALDETGVSAGQTVLVQGGAGGVGSIAVQVFARRGLHVVATAGGDDVQWVRALGAAEAIDYRTTRFEDVARDVDLLFDTVGGETLERSFQVMKTGGAAVSLSAIPPVSRLVEAGMSVPAPLKLVLPLATWWKGRGARAAGVKFAGQVTVPSGARLDALTAMAQDEAVQARVDRTFRWSELDQAVEHVASGAARGRVVITRW